MDIREKSGIKFWANERRKGERACGTRAHKTTQGGGAAYKRAHRTTQGEKGQKEKKEETQGENRTNGKEEKI